MRLTAADALEFLCCNDLALLGARADEVAETQHPGGIRTYQVERNINYTNICMSGCRFCAFCRNETSPDAYILDDETILQKIAETVELGGRQILLQGGLHPALPLTWYERLLQMIKMNFPQVNIHGFSPTEIVHFSDTYGLSLREVLERLREAGLDSLPGGGAEILVDRVRQLVSPKKASTDRWLDACKTWLMLGGRGSVTMMMGHLETVEERVEHLQRIRDLQDSVLAAGHTGLTAFIPWVFQPKHTQLASTQKLGSWEYLRFLAVSRLFLDNIPTIQSSWVTQGLQLGTLGLSFGANDLGSIMIEENVVAAAGTIFRSTEQAFCEAISAAGYKPQRRPYLV